MAQTPWRPVHAELSPPPCPCLTSAQEAVQGLLGEPPQTLLVPEPTFSPRRDRPPSPHPSAGPRAQRLWCFPRLMTHVFVPVSSHPAWKPLRARIPITAGFPEPSRAHTALSHSLHKSTCTCSRSPSTRQHRDHLCYSSPWETWRTERLSYSVKVTQQGLVSGSQAVLSWRPGGHHLLTEWEATTTRQLHKTSRHLPTWRKSGVLHLSLERLKR